MPEGACPYCWEKHDKSFFVPPVVPENPNIIIVLGTPTQGDIKYGELLKTPAGKELRRLFIATGAKPIILHARQCYRRADVTTDQIHLNREAFLLPILEKYPKLPVVAMGRFAATYMQGGSIPKKEPPVNRTRILYERLVVFTYDTDYYLEVEDERGAKKAQAVLDNIKSTIDAALKPIPTVSFLSGQLPTDVRRITVDIEATSSEYPWCGTRMTVLGIKPLHGPPYTIRADEITQEFKDLLNATAELVIGHNLMYDLVVLSYHGITFPRAKLHDTMVYHKNLFPNEWFYGLKPLVKKYHKFHHWDAWFGTKFSNKEAQDTLDEVKLFTYNAWDLIATETLYLAQQKEYVPFRLEMDYMPYVIKMTMNGMHVDVDALKKLTVETGEQLDKLEAEVREEFCLGKDFNFNSHPQISNFIKKYVPDLKDTTKDTLVTIQEAHPFVGKLLSIKKLNKFKGTGLEGLAEWVTLAHKVHSYFQVHGAETGRSSSSKPNLQNTDPKVRACFISRFDGGRLVYTDLASLEYRLIAHATADPKLLRIFINGEDIHENAYHDVYNLWPPDKTERKKGKTLNFGGVYGCGYIRFLEISGLEDTPASRALYNKMQNLYPGVTRWKENMIRQLRKTGKIRNLFGRVREFEFPITNDDEREAFNWIIQSSGHDILKIYLMEVFDIVALNCPQSVLVSEVHDSMTFDCPADEYETVMQIMTDIGGNLNPLIAAMFGVTMRVPMFAEMEVLERWA